MFADTRQPPTLQAAAWRPPAVSLEAILVLLAFVLAGLVWLAVGGAVMRSVQKPAIRPAHQILPRAAAGEDLATSL